MDTIAAGFWGAFFGTAFLMLCVSMAAFARAQRQVALMAGLSAVVSAVFVGAHLHWLPVEDATAQRLLAHVAVVATVVLGLMFFSTLGLLRTRRLARFILAVLLGAAVVVIAVGWRRTPLQAQTLGSLMAMGVGGLALVAALRSALRRERLGWAAVLGVVCMLVGVGALGWIAHHGTAPWQLHAVAAATGMTYLSLMAVVIWSRYSYLLGLVAVIADGPSYDPVTRMRSHGEMGEVVGRMFYRSGSAAQPVGVIAICIANLYALENLHGRVAFNHALHICAARLRRRLPTQAEVGRLGDDGFLVLLPAPLDIEGLLALARTLRHAMARPVTLGTRADLAGLSRAGMAWEAKLGVGVLATTTEVTALRAVATARAIARTAWAFPSRLAIYDLEVGEIAELPLADADIQFDDSDFID